VLVQVAIRIGTTCNSWGVTNTGTDAGGRFEVLDLEPGTDFVEAVSPDLANVRSEPIVIDGAGPTAMLVLRLERGARLLGSVRHADGDSHADVVHLLRRDDPLTDDEHEDAGNVVQECGLVIDGPGVHRRDIVVP
jgi:hypothetical protein